MPTPSWTESPNWKPIRKLLAVFVGAALTWLALRLGVDLGPDTVEDAAPAIVGVVLGYVFPDPRVAP